MVVKVLAPNIASYFIDPFDDQPDIDQAPEGDFFTDLKKIAHNGNFKGEWKNDFSRNKVVKGPIVSNFSTCLRVVFLLFTISINT
jgi:hypothetical protein